jgi:hypothetical protein
MGKLKEYYLNDLTDDEINSLYEFFSETEELLPKDSSTSQLEVDKDKHQTYPYDN